MRAARFAAEEARPRGAPLRVVHAVSWPFDGPPALRRRTSTCAGLLRPGAEPWCRPPPRRSADLLPADRVTTEVVDGGPGGRAA